MIEKGKDGVRKCHSFIDDDGGISDKVMSDKLPCGGGGSPKMPLFEGV